MRTLFACFRSVCRCSQNEKQLTLFLVDARIRVCRVVCCCRKRRFGFALIVCLYSFDGWSTRFPYKVVQFWERKVVDRERETVVWTAFFFFFLVPSCFGKEVKLLMKVLPYCIVKISLNYKYLVGFIFHSAFFFFLQLRVHTSAIF